jgi:hypothetical protein
MGFISIVGICKYIILLKCMLLMIMITFVTLSVWFVCFRDIDLWVYFLICGLIVY